MKLAHVPQIIATMALGAVFTGPALAQAPSIEIVQRPSTTAVDATLAWVKDDDQAWTKGKPMFQIANKGTELAATGWAAASTKGLLLKIDVTDDYHFNNRIGADLWNGDFVRVSVDGYGDGPRGAAKTTNGPFGPDDRSFGFALTKKGPAGWSFGTNRPIDVNVVRDDSKKLTTFRIGLGWDVTGILPGAFQAFGLGISVRDADTEINRNPPMIHWGEGGGSLTTALFKTVALSKAPTSEAYGVYPMNNTLWGAGEAVGAWVNALGAGASTVVVQAGNERVEKKLAANATPAERRLNVRIVPAAKSNLDTVNIKIVDDSGKVRAEETLAVQSPERTKDQVLERLDALIPKATPPIFKRHLTSIKAVTMAEWARLQIYRAADPVRAAKTAKYLEMLHKGLNGDGATWKPYVDGRRTLFMAFISKTDGSLQSYSLTLPKTWDPALNREKQPRFPLFVELHGAGDDHQLGDPAALVAEGGGAFAGLGYEATQPYARATRKGYHLEPFGRGNLGYRGIAEIDVFEAYDDVRAMFRVDEDRQYLYGFSMGGEGTWDVGTRTPDHWAAVAVLGASPRIGNDGVASNLAAVPAYTWSGDQDFFAAAGFHAFVDGAKAAGVALTAKQSAGVSHNYLASTQKETYEWLLTHTRKRPNKFSFVADTDEHRGQWGIEMKRDLTVSGLPHFACTIEGNKVTIVSEGTPGLRVDLGVKGLNLKGKVTVIWNGKTVFEGDAKSVEKPLEIDSK